MIELGVHHAKSSDVTTVKSNLSLDGRESERRKVWSRNVRTLAAHSA